MNEIAKLIDQALAGGENRRKLPGIGLSRADVERYSVAKVIRAAVQNEPLDGLEREAHQEMSKRKLGGNAVTRGVPFDILTPRTQRDLQVGVFGQGGAVVATQVSSAMIPLLRNRVHAVRLGATVIDGLTSNLAIPRQTSPSTVQALPEIGQATDSTPTLDQVLLSSKRASSVVRYGRQLVFRSSISLEAWLRQDLFDQVAITLDRYILTGQGGADEPLSVLNTPGVGSVLLGGPASYQKLVSMETALGKMNATGPGMAYLTSPGAKGVLKGRAVALDGATTVSSRPVWDAGDWGDGSNDGKINGLRAADTNQIPNDQILFGSWPEVILGIFGDGIDLIYNPYTFAASAEIQLVATIFADVAVRHPASFCLTADGVV